MPWLTAGMTLVPSAMPTSMRPAPTSVTRSGSILFWNVTVEPGVAVVAGLVGEVERRELDARDVAEADRRAWSGSARAGGADGAGDGRGAGAGDGGAAADPSDAGDDAPLHARGATAATSTATAMARGRDGGRWTRDGRDSGLDGRDQRTPTSRRSTTTTTR